MNRVIDAERSFQLSFTEENYPGWQMGEKLPNPYEHTDGVTYTFTGTAIAEEVKHQVGATVEVTVGHYPAVA